MLVLANLGLLLNMVFKFRIAVLVEQPLEDGFLDLLVIFLLKKVIVEKFHGADDEHFPALLTRVEGTDWPIGWERNGTTRQDRHSRSADIKSRTVRIDEFKTAILISLNHFIFILVSLCILASLLLGLLSSAISDAHKLLIKYTVADEGLLGVKVLVKVLPYDGIAINADTDLLEQGVNVGIKSTFTAFLHDDECGTTILNE